MSNAEKSNALELAGHMRDVLDATGVVGKTRVLEVVTDCDPVWITLAIEQWSVSLIRRVEVPVTLLAARSEVRDRARHRFVAFSRTERLRTVQHRRHRVAMTHGLPLAGKAELDALRVQIDRTTAIMLLSDDIDLAGLVSSHRRSAQDGSYEDETMCPVAPPRHRCSIRLREADAAPILIYELPLPGATLKCELRHDVFATEATLPDTILTAALGRRLGELVATGVPTLDRRRIVSADQGDGSVSFTLEPDLITISEAMRSFAPG